MVSEVTIKVKGEQSSYTAKHLVYDPIQLNPLCANLDTLINEAKQAYKDAIESIQIKVTCEVQ